MNKRDLFVGLVIIAVLAGLIYYWRTPVQDELLVPQTLSIEDEIEEAFNVEIPEDVDRAELEDVAGVGARAIATKDYESGVFSHTVLADLPEPESGKFYQGWLEKDGEIISSGTFNLAKGGYLLNFETSDDYSDYMRVIVSKESILDNTIEERMLEGSF